MWSGNYLFLYLMSLFHTPSYSKSVLWWQSSDDIFYSRKTTKLGRSRAAVYFSTCSRVHETGLGRVTAERRGALTPDREVAAASVARKCWCSGAGAGAGAGRAPGVAAEEEGSVGGPTHILQAAENSCRGASAETSCHFGIHPLILVKFLFWLVTDIVTTAAWSVYQTMSPTHSSPSRGRDKAAPWTEGALPGQPLGTKPRHGGRRGDGQGGPRANTRPLL